MRAAQYRGRDRVNLGEATWAGAIAGLVGGIVTWIYEAGVWAGAQNLMPLVGIPRNPLAWGVLFAWPWPYFREHG